MYPSHVYIGLDNMVNPDYHYYYWISNTGYAYILVYTNLDPTGVPVETCSSSTPCVYYEQRNVDNNFFALKKKYTNLPNSIGSGNGVGATYVEIPFENITNSFYYHPEFSSIVTSLFIICLVVVFLISKLFKTLFFGFKRT